MHKMAIHLNSVSDNRAIAVTNSIKTALGFFPKGRFHRIRNYAQMRILIIYLRKASTDNKKTIHYAF